MIELQDVAIRLRGRTLVEPFSTTFRAGTVTCLVGSNRGALSTLFRAVAGLEHFSGQILFDGRELAEARPEVYACFGDAALLPSLSGYENLRLSVGRALSRRAIASVAPALAADSILRMPAHTLGIGERRRLHLLAALASGARYLLFDFDLDDLGRDAPSTIEVRAAFRRRSPQATVLLVGASSTTLASASGKRRMLPATGEEGQGECADSMTPTCPTRPVALRL